jgi:hypothetical protein
MRWLGWLGIGCVLACGPQVGDADGDGDASASESDASAEDSASPTGSATLDDGGADTGVVPDGLYVHCDELGPEQPTIAGGDPTPLGFPQYGCNPREVFERGVFECCSSDPATADGQLPAYEGKGISGSPPLYADAANTAGVWGMCVRTADIPAGSGLLSSTASNCPIPCNPTWDLGDIETVCGLGGQCCQTLELGPKDCVQDENGLWRPVSGEDIGSNAVTPATNWNAVAHDTHQDPNGTVCAAKFEISSAEFAACVRELSVAEERGFCMYLSPDQFCPSSLSSYIDACEDMNS